MSVRLYLSKVLSHSVVYGCANALTVVVGLLLAFLCTRWLPLQDFGVLSLVATFGAFLLYAVDLGLNTAFVRLYYDYPGADRAARRDLVATVLWSQSVAAVALILLVALAAPIIARLILGDDSAGAFVQLMAVAVLFNSIAGIPLNVLRVEQRPGAYVLLIAVKQVVLLVSVVFLVGVGHRGVRGVFEGHALAGLLALMAGLLLARRSLGVTFVPDICRKLLRIGLPFWPAMPLGAVIDYSALYFQQRFLSLEDVGIYALGQRIAQVVSYVVLAFMISWTPLLFRILQEERWGVILSRLLKYYVMALAGLTLVVSVFAEPLVRWLATDAYVPAARLVPLIGLAYFNYGLFMFFLSGILVAKRLQYQSAALVVGVIVHIGCSPLLIPAWGGLGAAVSMVIAYAVVCVFGYRFAQRLFPIPYRIGTVLRIVASSGIAYGVFALGRAIGWGEGWAASAALAGYPALLLALRVVSREELFALRGWRWHSSEIRVST